MMIVMMMMVSWLVTVNCHGALFSQTGLSDGRPTFFHVHNRLPRDHHYPQDCYGDGGAKKFQISFQMFLFATVLECSMKLRSEYC